MTEPNPDTNEVERVIPLTNEHLTHMECDGDAITFHFDHAASVTLVAERYKREWVEHDRPEKAGDVFFLDSDQQRRVKYSQPGFIVGSNVRLIREASATHSGDATTETAQ